MRVPYWNDHRWRKALRFSVLHWLGEESMEIDFWKSVRDWQTAIASFVGFSGVITTLFVNAHLVRRNEYRQRLRELKSLRTALREEMIFTRDGLISALSTPAPENSNPSYDEMIINGSGDCGIYKANLGKMGLSGILCEGSCFT